MQVVQRKGKQATTPKEPGPASLLTRKNTAWQVPTSASGWPFSPSKPPAKKLPRHFSSLLSSDPAKLSSKSEGKKVLEFKGWLYDLLIKEGRYTVPDKGVRFFATELGCSGDAIAKFVRGVRREPGGEHGLKMKEAIARMWREGKAIELFDGGYLMADWEDREMCLDAIKKVIETSGIAPADIVPKHFGAYGAERAISGHFNLGLWSALRAAGYAYSPEDSIEQAKMGWFRRNKVHIWERRNKPDFFYGNRRLMAAAALWVAYKLGKKPDCLNADDLRSCGLHQLLAPNHFRSVRNVVLEAEKLRISTSESK